MHSFKPLALVRIDPLEVGIEALEDPYFIPKASQLTIDLEPGYYLYEMHFPDSGGAPIRLRGIVGKLSLGDEGFKETKEDDVLDPEAAVGPPDPERLLAHEMTLATIKSSSHDQHDAWGPVWLLNDDSAFDEIENLTGTLVARVTDSHGVHHRMSQIVASGYLDLIRDLISKSQLIVADGHHRIRNALEGLGAHKKSENNGRSEFITFISSLSDASRLIHPIHRAMRISEPESDLMQELQSHFVLEALDDSPDIDLNSEFPTLVTKEGQFSITAIVSATNETISTLDRQFRSTTSDSEILTDYLKETPREIFYRFDPAEIESLIASGKADLGIICRAVTTDRIEHAAYSHKLLPPKSTLFYPKPLASLMLQEASPPEED